MVALEVSPIKKADLKYASAAQANTEVPRASRPKPLKRMPKNNSFNEKDNSSITAAMKACL